MIPAIDNLFLIIIAAGLLAAAGCRMLVSGVLRERFLDQPNARSLHASPVPRSGGLAIQASIALAAAALLWADVSLPPAPFWIGWLIVVGVSLCDDMGHVSFILRFALQLAAVGILFAWLGPVLPWSWWFVLLAALALVWFINLFNFMDGMDGLAGVMGLTGAVTLAIIGMLQGDVGYASLLAVTGAAIAGFLVFNLPPARLFMGDSGSIGLGYFLGALAIVGVSRGLFGWPVPLLVFLPFLLDATWTLVKRVLRGVRPWEAHREHLYQRLVLHGWSARRVLVLVFPIMLAFQGLALFLALA